MFGLDLHLGRDFVGIEFRDVESVVQVRTTRIWRTAIDSLDPAVVQGVMDAATLVRVWMEHLEDTPALRVGRKGIEDRAALWVGVFVDDGGWDRGCRGIIVSLRLEPVEKCIPPFEEYSIVDFVLTRALPWVTAQAHGHEEDAARPDVQFRGVIVLVMRQNLGRDIRFRATDARC